MEAMKVVAIANWWALDGRACFVRRICCGRCGNNSFEGALFHYEVHRRQIVLFYLSIIIRYGKRRTLGQECGSG